VLILSFLFSDFQTQNHLALYLWVSLNEIKTV